jgi:hypothetical protein
LKRSIHAATAPSAKEYDKRQQGDQKQQRIHRDAPRESDYQQQHNESYEHDYSPFLLSNISQNSRYKRHLPYKSVNNQSVGALIDGESFVLTAVTHIGVDLTSLVMTRTRRLAQALGFHRLPIGVGAPPPSLCRPFLGFGLGSLGFGCALLGRGARAFSLNRATPGLLAQLSSLLTTTFLAPTARDTGGYRDKQHYDDDANDNCDNRTCTHGFLPG